jgi:hypothetical protein
MAAGRREGQSVFIMRAMALDLSQIRLDNALLLFDEFVQQAARNPDAATLRGLEGRFAERLQIQPSYWSQIKSRARQIGERLARQFEACMHKPTGWMDAPHGSARVRSSSMAPAAEPDGGQSPRNNDERFIVDLVLTYFRRHPERARARLLDLLGEALGAPASAPGSTPIRAATRADDDALWKKAAAGVAPLRRKR